MNKYLEQLIELSDFDKQIDSFNPEIENKEKIIDSKLQEITKIDENIKKIEDEIQGIKIEISNTNLQIEEFSKRLKEQSKKTAMVKKEREAKSLIGEEEVAKEQLNAANTEITRLEKLIDTKQEIIKELFEKKDALQKEFKKIKQNLETEIVKLKSQISEVALKKELLLKNMDQKIITFYEKIRKWAKNTAVVPVRKQACYGCFLKINEKTYYSVLKGDEITTCPHCGRVLYKENS